MGYKVKLKEDRERILKEELEKIISRLPSLDIEKAILIGSLAEGKVHKASDIDLIIIKKTDKKFLDRIDEIYKQLDSKVALDVFVYTPQEFEQMKQDNPFIKRALKTGRIIYEKR